MRVRRLLPVVVGALVVAIASTTPAQDPVPGLQDLVGTRGRDGEALLQQRGYEYRWAEPSGDSAYSYWTQINTGECITVRTTDGRYASVVSTPTSDCDRGDPRHMEGASNSTPRALADLVGARAGQAEAELQRRGYTYRSGEQLPNGIGTFWTEGNSGQCVEIITADGRYEEIFYVEWYHCN